MRTPTKEVKNALSELVHDALYSGDPNIISLREDMILRALSEVKARERDLKSALEIIRETCRQEYDEKAPLAEVERIAREALERYDSPPAPFFATASADNQAHIQ